MKIEDKLQSLQKYNRKWCTGGRLYSWNNKRLPNANKAHTDERENIISEHYLRDTCQATRYNEIDLQFQCSTLNDKILSKISVGLQTRSKPEEIISQNAKIQLFFTRGWVKRVKKTKYEWSGCLVTKMPTYEFGGANTDHRSASSFYLGESNTVFTQTAYYFSWFPTRAPDKQDLRNTTRLDKPWMPEQNYTVSQCQHTGWW